MLCTHHLLKGIVSFPMDKDWHVLEHEHVQLFLQVSEQESHLPVFRQCCWQVL